MLSRVANSIYWMNRYVERAENYARFLDVNFNLTLEQTSGETDVLWKPLVLTTGDWDLFSEHYSEVSKTNVIRFLGFDAKNPNSIYNCIVNARENARSIRPEITADIWEHINDMYWSIKDARTNREWEASDPRVLFNKIKEACHLLYGIMTTTLSRNDGWHIGNIGRLLERADKTSRIIDVKCNTLMPRNGDKPTAVNVEQWAVVLKSVSAYEMYRKKYGALQPKKVIDFLLFDEEFPRSVQRCVKYSKDSMLSLSGRETGYCDEVEEELQKVYDYMDGMSLDDIIKIGLHEFLDDIQLRLIQISTEIFDAFFSKSRSAIEMPAN